VEQTATAAQATAPTPVGAPFPDGHGLPPLGTPEPPEAMPRQRGTVTLTAPAPRVPALPAPPRAFRPWLLLPGPRSTPFTFTYAAVLVATSYVAAHADPALVRSLLWASSTDVAHLVRTPVLVLPASALWIAGSLLSPYAIGFLLVLTALERRLGGVRAAAVFLLGHVLATLATEVPVGFAVLAGELPHSSLHRLDYGISYGVACGTGALAGLLAPRLRWPVLALFGAVLIGNMIEISDLMTDCGHLIALSIGIATWPWVRRSQRERQQERQRQERQRQQTQLAAG
jgi:hypothetical protein